MATVGKQAITLRVKNVLQTTKHDKASVFHVAFSQNIIFHMINTDYSAERCGGKIQSTNWGTCIKHSNNPLTPIFILKDEK